MNKYIPLFNKSKTETLEYHKHGVVNLFWFEKATLILDMLQIYGLLWICAQPWPWPYLWSHWTRWIVFANIDAFSLTPNGALAGGSSNIGISKWGNMDGYVYYACYFVSFQTISLFLALMYWRSLGQYGENWVSKRSNVIAACLAVLHGTMLPVTLAVFRLYYCEPNENILSADRAISCTDPQYISLTIICSLCHLPVLIGLPIITYRYIRAVQVYQFAPDHEKRIQSWEIFYVLGLDSDWLEKQVWLTSSFKASGAYFRLHILVLKLTMLLNFIFIRQSLAVQACIMWLSLATFFVKYCVCGFPFRCRSTNALLLILSGLLIVDCSFGVANSLGVENAIMVSSTESLWLMSSNVIGLMCVVAVLVFSAISPAMDWPVNKTLYRIKQDRSLLRKVLHWIEAVKDAHKALVDFMSESDELADIDTLEEAIRNLRQCWVAAKACGSIFSVPISELLEDLIYVHSIRKPRVLRNYDHWNRQYEDTNKSNRFKERHNKLLMMAPQKRRILTKLLVLKSFMDGKKANNSSGSGGGAGGSSDGQDDCKSNYDESVYEFNLGMEELSVIQEGNEDDPSYTGSSLNHSKRSLAGADGVFNSHSFSSNKILGELQQQQQQQQKQQQQQQQQKMENMQEALRVIVELEHQSEAELTEQNTNANQLNEEEAQEKLKSLEEMIYLWNDLIDMVEEDSQMLTVENNKLFSNNRIETWYIYRQELVQKQNAISEMFV